MDGLYISNDVKALIIIYVVPAIVSILLIPLLEKWGVLSDRDEYPLVIVLCISWPIVAAIVVASLPFYGIFRLYSWWADWIIGNR